MLKVCENELTLRKFSDGTAELRTLEGTLMLTSTNAKSKTNKIFRSTDFLFCSSYCILLFWIKQKKNFTHKNVL